MPGRTSGRVVVSGRWVAAFMIFSREKSPLHCFSTCISAIPDPPGPLHERNRAVPPPVEAVVHRGMRKDPDERYQSAAEMLHDLEHLDDIDLSQFVLGPERPAKEPPSDRRILLPGALIGGGFMLLIVLVVLLALVVEPRLATRWRQRSPGWSRPTRPPCSPRSLTSFVPATAPTRPPSIHSSRLGCSQPSAVLTSEARTEPVPFALVITISRPRKHPLPLGPIAQLSSEVSPHAPLWPTVSKQMTSKGVQNRRMFEV